MISSREAKKNKSVIRNIYESAEEEWVSECRAEAATVAAGDP